MNTQKIVKELVRRGLEFRGEITLEKVKAFKNFNKEELEYGCKAYNCETYLYFAMRKEPEGGQVGNTGTNCKDILITVDNTNDDACVHLVCTDSWFIPEMRSEINPNGVWSLEVCKDCRIKQCSHAVGCISYTSWHFDEYWNLQYKQGETVNAFDTIANTFHSYGFLPETCKKLLHVYRPCYRNEVVQE